MWRDRVANELRRARGRAGRRIPAPAAFQPRLGVLVHHPPKSLPAPASRPHRPATLTRPRISLVTPSFNQGDFIGQTVSSVLDQAYPNLEYIVRDGGSTDGTLTALDRIEHRHEQRGSATRLSIVTTPDQGQADALNRGFAETDGDLMGWLNSDDLLMPGALHTVADYFAEHPEVDVVYGHRVLVDAQTRCIGRWILPPHDPDVLSWADYVPQETLFWRRGLWERVGGIDDTMDFAIDWDLLLRFRRAGATMVRLPRLLGMFRVHEHSKTSTAIAERGEQEMMALRRRELGRAVEHSEISRAVRPYLQRHLVYDRLWEFGIAI